MPETLTSRQAQALSTQQKIYDVGYELLKSVPIDKIKIQDIIKACGISTGAFYHYYASKEMLFVHLMHDQIRSNEEFLCRMDASAASKIRLYLLRRFTIAEQRGLLFERNVQQFRMTEEYRKGRREAIGGRPIQHGMYNLISEILQRGMEVGELSPDIDVPMVGQTITYIIHGAIYNQCLYDVPLKLIHWGEQFCQEVLEPMLAPYILRKLPMCREEDYTPELRK